MKTVKEFYASKEWRTLRYNLIIERMGICQRCNTRIRDTKKLHGHHKIELTINNFKDSSISLNPELIEIICDTCHNEEHKRFTTYEKKVFIVYGAPFCGYDEYVMDQAKQYDLIIDIDSIYEMVTNNPRYIKPQRMFQTISNVHNHLLDMVRTRTGEWVNAWIIGGYPSRVLRNRLVEKMRAELIYIDTDKVECMKRMVSIEGIDVEFWRGIIQNYFNVLEPEEG